ncbi:MAG TPA: hypothetical protein VKP12_07775 [Kiloniellaceae bacterium]|nr:hypothetical protein [Kiloniellaceae bacterium]
MTPRRLLLAIPFLATALAPAGARAEITLPDCATLAAWYAGVDTKDWRQLNPSTTLGFPGAFLGPEMANLYGKTADEFSLDDVAAARQGIKGCHKALGKAEARQLAAMDKQLARSVGGTLQAIAKAEAALGPALDALEAAPDGLDKLRAIAGFRAMVEWDDKGYLAAVRYMSRDFNRLVDPVMRAVKSLPQSAVAERVLPRIEPQYAASRDAALAEISEQIAALEASEQGLRRFDRDAGKIVEPMAAVLPAEERATLETAVAARKTAIEEELVSDTMGKLDAQTVTAFRIRAIEDAAGGNLMRLLSPEKGDGFKATLRERRQQAALALVAEVPDGPQGLATLPQLRNALATSPGGLVGEAELVAIDAAIDERRSVLAAAVAADLLQRIAATPAEADAFVALDRYAQPQTLSLLDPEAAAAVRDAAEARRREIGDRFYPLLAEELKGLDESEKSLAVIDTALLPEIQAWPASAGEHKARFLDVVVERRNAILASITEAERGPLRGRSYADRAGTMKLDFQSGGKAYMTAPDGQTLAVPYEEDGDSRVLVTLPQGTLVLTREGRWLVSGPVQLQRTDTSE